MSTNANQIPTYQQIPTKYQHVNIKYQPDTNMSTNTNQMYENVTLFCGGWGAKDFANLPMGHPDFLNTINTQILIIFEVGGGGGA